MAVLLLGAAVILGLVRSILDTYFTTREVELPPPPAATWPATAKRVAIFVLDGLRPMEAFNPDYMPALAARCADSAWGIARTGEITMTVPGVRMLGAGVSSDFLEILHNWTPRASPAPSLFKMAKTKGLHTVLVGDHVWRRAFGLAIDRHLDTRLDAWAYYRDPVHAPDESHMEDLHAMLAANDPFDVLIVHFVGPDHASHRNRVTSSQFRNYTRWLDPKLDDLLDGLLALGTTILVTSDHGMSDGGQHGGDEPTARKTPYLLQGPGIRIGPGPLLNQADLPATLAALLALPMPPFGEGRVAHEVLGAPAETILAATAASLAQAQTYLRGYEKKYGGVPRSLLDGAPDLPRVAAELGVDAALAQANRYFDAYHDQRCAVTKSVGRTWAWLLTILLFVAFVLLPARSSALPRGARWIAGLALLLSLASWVTSDALWPTVVAALGASIWLGAGLVVERCRALHSIVTQIATGAGIVGLLALAHVAFNRQFRSSTMLSGVSDTRVRVAVYAVVVVIGVLFVLWLRRGERWSLWLRQACMGLAVILLFLTMLPSGKLLLLVAPGLALGSLWLYRLGSLGRSGSRLKLMALLESEWLLFLATLAWVLVESWFAAVAWRVDQDRGVLGWTLNRLPWLLAPALVYQQIIVGGRAQRHLAFTAKVLSTLSVLLTLPPLLLAHHAQHSNLLVGSALAAMLLAAVNRRSALATYQLGAATYALTTLYGSASYALLCLVLVGTYWVFVLAPTPRPAGPADERANVLPILAALAACLVWLTLHRFRDGSFSFSDIEITVAFYGNATHTLGQGVVQVSARFILPMVLLLIPLQRMDAPQRVFAGIIAIWLLHIAFLLVGFLATQSQFYTPYRLAGELAHFVALLTAIPILYLVFAAVRNPSPVQLRR